jgi:hypothetical protein
MKESNIEQVIKLASENVNIQVISSPSLKQQDFRVKASKEKVSNNIVEQPSVVNDKVAHVAKKKNSDVQVIAKLPDQQTSPIVKQPQVIKKKVVSSNNIIESKKVIDKTKLKLMQTSPVGKHAKPNQTLTNNNEVHGNNESEKVMKQLKTSPVKTIITVKKTNLPVIKHKNIIQTDSEAVMNDKKDKREHEQTVPPNDIEKFEIPRKKKVKTDLTVSNELKKPPINNVEVIQINNTSNKSKSTVVNKMIKTKSGLNENNKIIQKKPSTIDEANAKRALVAKTQLFGNTVMTTETISDNNTTQSNKSIINLYDLITPKQTKQTKTIVSRETIDEKVLTYDDATKSNTKVSKNPSENKSITNDDDNVDEDDDDAKSNETDIGKKPKIGNREMAGLKFAREYGKETFHVMDDPASDSNQRSTRKKLQINEKGSAHGTYK